jgi:hypothetical protein
MAAGRRDTDVDIQFLRPESENDGYPVERWQTREVGVMMNRQDVRADERWTASQTSAFVETIFQMPYLPCMDPDLVDVPNERRLVLSGRVFDIRAASMIGRRQGLELLTLSGTRIPEDVS